MPGTYADRVKALGLTPEWTEVDHFGPHTLELIETLMGSGYALAAAYKEARGLRECQVRAMLEFKLEKKEVKNLNDYQLDTMRSLVNSGKTPREAYELVKGLEDHQVQAVVVHNVLREMARGLSIPQVEAIAMGWPCDLVVGQDCDWKKIGEITSKRKEHTPGLELTLELLNEMSARIAAHEIFLQTMSSGTFPVEVSTIPEEIIQCGIHLVLRGWREIISEIYRSMNNCSIDTIKLILLQIQQMPSRSFELLPPPEEIDTSKAPGYKEAGLALGLTHEQMSEEWFGWHTIRHMERKVGPFMEPKCMSPARGTETAISREYYDDVYIAYKEAYVEVSGLTAAQLKLVKLGVERGVVEVHPPSNAFVRAVEHCLERNPGLSGQEAHTCTSRLSTFQIGLYPYLSPEQIKELEAIQGMESIPPLVHALRKTDPSLVITPDMCKMLSQLDKIQAGGILCFHLTLEQVRRVNFGGHTLDLMRVFRALSQDVVAKFRVGIPTQEDEKEIHRMAYDKAIEVPREHFAEGAVAMILTSANIDSQLDEAKIKERVTRERCTIL